MLKLAEIVLTFRGCLILFGVLAWNKIYTAMITVCCASRSPGPSMHSSASVALCRDGSWAHAATSEGTQQKGIRYPPDGSSVWATGNGKPEELPHTKAQPVCTKSFDTLFKTVLPINHNIFFPYISCSTFLLHGSSATSGPFSRKNSRIY